MIEAIQIITTVANQEQADRIAGVLVTRRLVACVQVAGPISSTYRWKGNVETSQEWLCIIKTARSRYEAVEAAIRELHAYEVPEILALGVVEGSRDYLDWLAAQLSPSDNP